MKTAVLSILKKIFIVIAAGIVFFMGYKIFNPTFSTAEEYCAEKGGVLIDTIPYSEDILCIFEKKTE